MKREKQTLSTRFIDAAAVLMGHLIIRKEVRGLDLSSGSSYSTPVSVV